MKLLFILIIFGCFACTPAKEDMTSPPTIIRPEELIRHDGLVSGWSDLADTVSPNVNVTGTIWIQATISAEGELIEAKVIDGIAPLVNESALRTIRRLKFRPAIQNGKPIKGNLKIGVIYQIK